jgi:hypothetical protein
MLRSPARRASENALPALLELGESEFGDSEGPERELDEGLGFFLGDGTNAEHAPRALGAPPEAHPTNTSSSSEDESEAASDANTVVSDDDLTSRVKSATELCPTPSSLGSFPVTPTTPGDFAPDDFVLALRPGSLDASSDSEDSSPASTPESTLERPKRRGCVELEDRRSLGAFIRGHYV